jgi:spermidine synthase
MRPAGLAVAAACAAALLFLVIRDQRSRTIFETDSPFGDVRVAERSDGLRSLYTGEGRARQSALYPDRPMHLEHAYTRVGMIGAALVPPRGRLLFVGLGGGAMPMYARQILPDALIDVVEIDPVIVAVAQRYFGFTPDERMTVHTDDGRAFIERASPATYDLIVLDAFSDDEVPFSLTTREFLAAVRAALTPDGVVVSNLWTAAAAYPSMLATYQAVFDHAHLLRVPRHAQRILVAGSATRPLHRTVLLQASQALARRVRLGFDLPALVAEGYEAIPAPNAPVLHDRAGTAAFLRVDNGITDGPTWHAGTRSERRSHGAGTDIPGIRRQRVDPARTHVRGGGYAATAALERRAG